MSEEDSQKLLTQVNEKAKVLDDLRKKIPTVRHDLSQLRSLLGELEKFESVLLLDTEKDSTSGVMLVNYTILKKKMVQQVRNLMETIIRSKVNEVIRLGKRICSDLESIKRQVS